MVLKLFYKGSVGSKAVIKVAVKLQQTNETQENKANMKRTKTEKNKRKLSRGNPPEKRIAADSSPPIKKRLSNDKKEQENKQPNPNKPPRAHDRAIGHDLPSKGPI